MDCKDIPTIQKCVLLDKLFAPGRFSKQATCVAKYFMTQIHFIKILNMLIEFPLLPVFLGIWLLQSLSKVLETCKYHADVSKQFSCCCHFNPYMSSALYKALEWHICQK